MENPTILTHAGLAMTHTASRPDSPGPPRVGVLALVWHRRRILLVQRSRAPQAGRWGFPGGHVEPGEQLTEAATRELLEETGIQAAAETTLPPIDLIERGSEGDLRHHFVLVPISLRYQGGQPAPSDDAIAAEWFEPEALPEPLCTDVADLVAASRPGGARP